MANVKITELTNLTDPSTTDVMPVVDVDADVTKKVSVGEVVGKITGDVEVATDGTATISELPVSKLQDGAARQLLQTAANGTDVEWTDDVDLPGTLDVTGVTMLDDALDVAGLASLDGGIDVDGVFTVANSTGDIATSGTLGVTGQSTLASAAVSDLTEDRVVIAGASGELEDSANLTFDGSELGITGTLDVSSNGTIGGDLTVVGDLTVEGATTTLETQTVTVEDKNIELGVVDTPSDTTADGGGITLKGDTDKTINWIDATDAWTFSEHVELASGKEFYIDGNGVLNATTLGSGVVNSSLTSVGTIATGTWQGTAIDAAYLDATVVTTSNTGTVTSTMILNGTIVNGDINDSAAIAGTKIDPDFGSQSVETTGVFSAAGGAEATPSIAFTGDLNTGIYSPGADQLAISTNGVQALYIDSDGDILVADGNRMEIDEIRARDGAGLKLFDDGGAGIFIEDGGNVGVKVTNPNTELSLPYTDTNGVSHGISWASTTGSIDAARIEMVCTGTGFGRKADLTFSTMVSNTAATEKMRITSDGKLGLGTSSPWERLSIPFDDKLSFGSSAYPFSISRTSSGGALETTFSDSYDALAARIDFVMRAGSASQSTPLSITGAGRVGIGTTSPTQKLQITDGSLSNFYIAPGYNGGTGTTIGVGGGEYLAFNGAPFTTERMRIDSSGRLLIGTSSSTNNVNGNSKIATIITGNGSSGGFDLTGYVGSGSSAYTPAINLQKSIGTTDGTMTAVGAAPHYLGQINFRGSDGTAFATGASIHAVSDNNNVAWSSGDNPGALVFSTTADGASSPTERMRIDSDGNVSFGASGYGLGQSDTVSINPSDGLISFGMNGREEYVTGNSGCYIYSGSGSSGTTLAGDLILQSRSLTQDRSITFVTGTTPAKRMEIAGNGDVTVVGAFSKGSGSFRIDHPLPEKKETHHLVHSFIEGPQADLIYRGHVQLVNGVATVNLDEAARMTEGTFEALCTNVCCFTSNESDWTAVRGSVSGNILTIEAQDPASDADVCWMVIGERKDQHMLDTNWTDENGRVITEPLKQQSVAEAD